MLYIPPASFALLTISGTLNTVITQTIGITMKLADLDNSKKGLSHSKV